MGRKRYEIKTFLKSLYKEKENNDKSLIEGYVYWERGSDIEGQISVCPPFRNIIELPVLYKIFENYGIQILEDEFRTDGMHGYSEYHLLRINFEYFRHDKEYIMEDIICKQLD